MKKHISTVGFFVVELVIYLVSFLIIMKLREQVLYLSMEYLIYLLLYLAAISISSFLTQKFDDKLYKRFNQALRTYSNAFILTLGFIAIFGNIFNLADISRKVLISSLVLGLLIEIIWLWIRLRKKLKQSLPIKIIFSSYSFLIESILISSVVIYISHRIDKTFGIFQNHIFLFAEIVISWLAAIALTYHFSPIDKQRAYWQTAGKHIKSYVLFILLGWFLIYTLRLGGNEKLLLITVPILYSFLSFIVLTSLYIHSTPGKTDEVRIKIVKATNYEDVDIISNTNGNHQKHKIPGNRKSDNLFSEKLESIFLKKFPIVYSYLIDKLELSSIDFMKAIVLRSSDHYNVDVLPDNSISFFMNLHEMNDIRRLNYYFIEINKKLENEGIFVGRFESIRLRHKRFLTKYSRPLGQIFYFLDFIWKRVFPKLPVFQKIYFAITRGRDRALPLAECLGRLYYCGFEVIDLKEIDGYVYFIAKKFGEPSSDKYPSYGLLFKMLRIGKNRKPIFVYKLRTMHPYSEYLQKLAYDSLGTRNGDKVQNDFRITKWGRYLRKIWIDELPMLINWFRGELKIVGVRPLSFHKFNTYPKELQLKRVKCKPGLIPPFYADLPSSQKEMWESEDRYLDQYFVHPVLTDVKYFFKCGYNIFIKKARSG